MKMITYCFFLKCLILICGRKCLWIVKMNELEIPKDDVDALKGEEGNKDSSPEVIGFVVSTLCNNMLICF